MCLRVDESLNTCGDLSYIWRKGGYVDGRVEREGERAPRSRSFANMAVLYSGT